MEIVEFLKYMILLRIEVSISKIGLWSIQNGVLIHRSVIVVEESGRVHGIHVLPEIRFFIFIWTDVVKVHVIK